MWAPAWDGTHARAGGVKLAPQRPATRQGQPTCQFRVAVEEAAGHGVQHIAERDDPCTGAGLSHAKRAERARLWIARQPGGYILALLHMAPGLCTTRLKPAS